MRGRSSLIRKLGGVPRKKAQREQQCLYDVPNKGKKKREYFLHARRKKRAVQPKADDGKHGVIPSQDPVFFVQRADEKRAVTKQNRKQIGKKYGGSVFADKAAKKIEKIAQKARKAPDRKRHEQKRQGIRRKEYRALKKLVFHHVSSRAPRRRKNPPRRDFAVLSE